MNKLSVLQIIIPLPAHCTIFAPETEDHALQYSCFNIYGFVGRQL